MSSHAWIDWRSLALHEAVAAKIEAHPELLDMARTNVARWITRAPVAEVVGERREMLRRTVGTTLLAGVLLVAGLAGIAGFWAAWPRTSNTSPLAALFALTWGCTCVVTAILTWRRSRFAGPAFLAAIGLPLFPARYIVPGGQLFLPSFVVIALLAILGYRYLRRVREAAA